MVTTFWVFLFNADNTSRRAVRETNQLSVFVNLVPCIIDVVRTSSHSVRHDFSGSVRLPVIVVWIVGAIEGESFGSICPKLSRQLQIAEYRLNLVRK